MKPATLEQVLEYRNNPHGGFLGNVTFVDDFSKDRNSLKDSYSVPAEVNMFCIVHGIDFIFDYEKDLDKKLDDLLGEYSESYLIPNVYDGYIVWDLEDNLLS